MPYRRSFIFTEISPHPRHALASNDVIGINQLLDSWDGRNVPADHNGRTRRKLPRHPAHLAHLSYIHNDRGDSDDVVMMRTDFLGEAFLCRKVEHRAGR